LWELERAGVAPLPGRSAVYRALIRYGLVDPKKRKRRREDYQRWERGRAMQLWQMDVLGRVQLAGGQEVKVVTGIDDHSRFVVCAKVVVAATARPVCLALAEALRRHGIPGQILTDNAKVFTARYRCSTTPSSTSTPGSFRRDQPIDRSQAPRMRKTRKPVRSVAHLPELLSASYRNRVRKVSPGNQNQGVKHLPGPHSGDANPSRRHSFHEPLHGTERLRSI